MADFEGKQKWMEGRQNMPTDAGSDELARLAPAIRAHSFFSARVANGHVLDKLREISDSYTRGETDIATARLRLKQWLDRNGAGKIEEPGSREDARMANLWSTARLNLILRQNARMAYAAGEWEQGQNEESRRMFPYWRYVASTSESPRSSHRQYAGKIYRKDDPIWHRIFPPWDFNCKCSVEEVAADEVAEDKVEPLTKEDKLPAIAESGFAFDPAEALRVYDPELIHDEELRVNTVTTMLEQDMLPEGGMIGKRTPPQKLQFLAKMPPASVLSPEDAAVIPDREKKKQLIAEIDEVLGHLAHLEGKKDTDRAAQLPAKVFELGEILPSHKTPLGLSFSKIVLKSPGNTDTGFKHWIKHHKPTLAGRVIIELFEKTIWNPFCKPFIVQKNDKTRLVYEWKDDNGNAVCSLFELNAEKSWSVIDAWVPSDKYFEEQEKRKGQ